MWWRTSPKPTGSKFDLIVTVLVVVAAQVVAGAVEVLAVPAGLLGVPRPGGVALTEVPGGGAVLMGGGVVPIAERVVPAAAVAAHRQGLVAPLDKVRGVRISGTSRSLFESARPQDSRLSRSDS